jgi:EpsI family protein
MTIGRRLLAVATLLVVAGVSARLTAASAAVPVAHIDQVPFLVGGWRGTDAGRLDAETERALGSDSYILRTFRRVPMELDLYVAYYGTQRAGHTIHSPLNCLPGTGWDWLERGRTTLTTADGSALTVNRAVAQRDADRLLIYYWYQGRGRAVADEYQNKLLLMRDALVRRRSDGALVRVVAPVTGPTDPSPGAEAFIGALYPFLVRELPE